ncbi:transposase [Halovibrio variabilis]|uniref:transposase n=1 Tax=Halovibrio variabilis TaxID=31910 RepID=UPI0035316686
MNRELYLPKGWRQDCERCHRAGIPDEIDFSRKPELARRMLERALNNDMPAGWVTGNSVYGGNRSLRLWLEEREQPFVLAVPRNEPLWGARADLYPGGRDCRCVAIRCWHRLSAGSGSKGERWYDWTMTPLWRLQLSEEERRWGQKWRDLPDRSGPWSTVYDRLRSGVSCQRYLPVLAVGIMRDASPWTRRRRPSPLVVAN